jgi:acyl-CoA thioesterase-1
MHTTAVARLCRFLLLTSILLLTTVCAQAQSSTIMVLGDSLSAGYGIAVREGWVALLRERLSQANTTTDYQVINASVSGETTQGGLARLDKLLSTHQPSLVIVELGANDGLRGQPIKLMRQNLAAIIKASQAADAKVVLVGMQIPPNYGTRYTRLFAETYPQLAERFSVALVPFLLQDVALKPHLMQNDGIHPNASAQPVLLKNIWPILEPLL